MAGSTMMALTGQIARNISRARPAPVLGWSTFASGTGRGEEARDVPAGHEHSDLRPAVSHIGLNRRRDLSLRADISVYSGAECVTLRDWLRGGTSVIFGLPDMGKACTEIHAPGFVSLVKEFEAVGVDHVWAVAIGDPEKVDNWARKCNLAEGRIRAVADRSGAFARLLGLEMNKPDKPGPHCQRYVGLVEDGILLKLKVDEEPGVVKDSSAQCMLDIIQSSKEKAAKEKAQKEKAGKDPIDPKASEEAPKSGAAKAVKEEAEREVKADPVTQPQGAGS